MGFANKTKGVYFFFEDKWYSFLDKINTKLPIYKVIDPVDKIIPSFIVFLLLVLFIVVLAGYLVQFSSPYDITITTYDSTTKLLLSGVIVQGELNGEGFDGRSNSDGEYSFTIESSRKNFFELLNEIIIPVDPDFSGYISANKDGYAEIKNKTIDFASTQHKIYLSPLPETPEYPSTTIVELRDSDSQNLIISNDSLAYVKFKCNNKTITPKTVRDDSDGTKDGKFTLSEDQCNFVITGAFSTGYVVDSIQKVLPTNKSVHQIYLDKKSVPTTGGAKVYVYDNNSPDNNKDYLDGIKVVFNGPSNTYSWTDDGIAEKTNLEAGEYIITITDENYYEITADSNIKLVVEPGKTTQLEIGLEKINPDDRRKVYFKVVNSIDGNAMQNVRVDLLWLNSDSNGNQFGTDGNIPLSYYSGASHTDINGVFVANSLTLRSEGQLVAILKKDGYVYKLFKPTFFKLTEGPEIIQLDTATAFNSGFAQINVKAGDSNRPLGRAQTYLYTNQTIDGKTITGISLEKNENYTDSNGTAKYFDLETGTSIYYLAQAKFEGAKSNLTPKKVVDANKTTFFDIHLDLDISYLEIELVDFQTRSQIQNSQQANIEIYTANSDFSEITFSEKLKYNAGFKSAGYLPNQPLLVKADLVGYVNQTISINQTLQSGANKIRILMVPKTLVTEDANVTILFDNMYKSTDFLLDSNSSVEVLTQGEEYVGRFFAVAGKDFTYKIITSLGRILGPTNITNISAMPQYLEELDAYTCTTQNMDSALTHDNNYYFPTLLGCKESGQDNKQAGFKWSDTNLPSGVYTFLVHFSVDANASDDELIEVQYKAKEKHNPETETPLMKLEFYVGQPLTASLALTAKVNDSAVPFSDNISPQIITIPGQANKLKVKIFNKTTETISSGYLKIYSYKGTTQSFSETTTATSKISFSATAVQNQKTLVSNLQISPFASAEYDTNFYINDAGSKGWIVIVMKANNETTIKFIDLKAKSRELIIDAEFLSMVNNQLFNGFVNSKFSDEDITIEDMKIDVKTNCQSISAPINTVHSFSGEDITKSTGFFEREIPGVYKSGIDCVDVEVLRATSPSGGYEPLTTRIYAGNANAQDSSLACIAIQTEGGETRGDPYNLYLDWEANGKINVTNTCASAATIKIETGITCSECTTAGGDSAEYTLAHGSNKIFNVTGKNVTYSSTDVFSDILGYFPFIIKAKLLSEGSSRKRFAVADEIGIHLRNENDCFIISNDVFDFFNDGDNLDFSINNDCQDLAFEDYFVPKSQIQSLNVNLNSQTPQQSYIDFDWDLVASGGTYNISYTTNIKKYYGGITMIDLNSLDKNVIDLNSTKYFGASANFSNVDGNIDEIYLKWQDVDTGDYFGAAVDGSIVVTYKDGTVISVQPRVTTPPGEYATCVCDGGNDTNSCTSHTTPTQNYCLVGQETQPGLNHLTYGITHNKIPEGEIEKIDFNIIGNSDLTYLTFKVTPHLITEVEEPIITPAPGVGEEVFKSGSFRIYPIENATFVLRNIAQDTDITGMTQAESFCKESSGGKAWEIGNYLYWVNPSFTTKAIAEKTCAQTDNYTNLLGQNGTLVDLTGNQSAVLQMLNENISDFSWLDINRPDGLWTGNCTGNTCDVIIEQQGTMIKSTASKEEIALYAPFCMVTKEIGFDFNATECATNVECDSVPNPPVCTLTEAHAENNFFGDAFIEMINPKVKFVIRDISSDSTTPLSTGAVLIWIEGKYLKAKFIGDNYANYSDGSIELELENNSSSNIQYSIINIKDYVNKGKIKNE